MKDLLVTEQGIAMKNTREKTIQEKASSEKLTTQTVVSKTVVEENTSEEKTAQWNNALEGAAKRQFTEDLAWIMDYSEYLAVASTYISWCWKTM